MLRTTILYITLFFSPFHLFAQSENIEYNFDCLQTDFLSSGISIFSDIEKSILQNYNSTVSVQEEISAGEEVFKEISKNSRLVNNGDKKNLDSILAKLVKTIRNPRGFNYHIYLVDSIAINAFTIGGNIYFTTEMMKFCKSNDEIAGIIGHEIAHNELGHINENLKRIKSTQSIAGESFGGWIGQLGTFMITPFNQQNEAHCDAFGVDLSFQAHFDGCSAVNLWKRMSDAYDTEKTVAQIFMSHPYSIDRKACIIEHIKRNYAKKCN